MFSKTAAQLTFPPTIYENFNSTQFWQPSCLYYYTHTRECEMVPYRDFDMNFPED